MRPVSQYIPLFPSLSSGKSDSRILSDGRGARHGLCLAEEGNPSEPKPESSPSLPASETPLTQSAPRQSSLDLLRIVAVLLIIAHHYAIHGGFTFNPSAFMANQLWLRFLWFGEKLGVNLLVLISGYFLIDSPKLKTHKALKLWLQIFTYAVSLFVIFLAVGMETFDFSKLLHTVLPITYSQWWFASTYFIFYLIHPFLGKLFRSLSKREYQYLLILTGFFWCVVPTLFGVFLESSNLLWFCYLFAVSGYVRLHGQSSRLSCRSCLLLGFGMLLLIALSIVLFGLPSVQASIFAKSTTYFCNEQRLPGFLASLFLFLGFQKMRIPYRKYLHTLSSVTLGVYLILDSSYLSSFSWKDFFRAPSFPESPLFIPHFLCVTLLVFFCCTLVELIRIHVLERSYTPFLLKLSSAIDQRLNRL